MFVFVCVFKSCPVYTARPKMLLGCNRKCPVHFSYRVEWCLWKERMSGCLLFVVRDSQTDRVWVRINERQTDRQTDRPAERLHSKAHKTNA